MDEREFRDRARAIFDAVLARLDREDPDEIEGESTAGVVKIRSKAGRVFVLNVQPPLREVWFAAGDRAWHFQFDAATGAWVDPRNGDALEATLTRTVSGEVGRAIEFRLPGR